MNTGIKLINGWKRSLSSLIMIPIILVGCIYISYGEVFESALTQQNTISSFFQLKTQLAIFNNDNEQELLGSLPRPASVIGFYSVIFVYLLFAFWLVISMISNYIKLSHGRGSKVLMLLELITILIIFIIFFNPGLNLWLSLIVYMIITFGIFLIVVYWLVDFNEEK